jgi:nucleotide-binding universal stress UspA family protein
MGPGLPTPYLSAEQRAELRDVVERDWCKPLAEAGVEFRVELTEGTPTLVIMEAVRTSDAQLVVVGRRGRGGFVELLLGSTSHQLAHHLAGPLVIVP